MICAIVTLNLIGENEIERVDRLFFGDVNFCYICFFAVTIRNMDFSQKNSAIAYFQALELIESESSSGAFKNAIKLELCLQGALRGGDAGDIMLFELLDNSKA